MAIYIQKKYLSVNMCAISHVHVIPKSMVENLAENWLIYQKTMSKNIQHNEVSVPNYRAHFECCIANHLQVAPLQRVSGA